MSAYRKRFGGLSPVELGVVIGGFSLLVIGLLLVIVVIATRRPADPYVAQAPGVAHSAPVAPIAPATSANPYAPPPPALPPSAVPNGSPAPESEGQMLVLTAQRLEPSTPGMGRRANMPFVEHRTRLVVAVFLVIGGIVGILSGVYDWRAFEFGWKFRIYLALFGRTGVRVIRVVTGVLMILYGVALLGLILYMPEIENFMHQQGQ
jgi:hypothetical protein